MIKYLVGKWLCYIGAHDWITIHSMIRTGEVIGVVCARCLHREDCDETST